jgi:hypothetical protein
MSFKNRPNWRDREQISGCQRLEVDKGLTTHGYEGFLRDNGTILCADCSGGLHVMHLSKLIGLSKKKKG